MTQTGWTFDAENPTYMVKAPPPRKSIHHGYLVQAYLWTRTILCPSCTGLIPLSPQWKLSKDVGVLLVPERSIGVVGFQVVPIEEMSKGTIGLGIATCPLCGAVARNGYPSQEAMADRMGHIEYVRCKRWCYPKYRVGKRPIQGKDKLEFEVPNGGGFWHSVKERERVLTLSGIVDDTWQTDPRIAPFLDPDYVDDGVSTLLDLVGLPSL